ncbi:N-acetylglutaminylglutamine amidotransferase [Aliidiomarina minuta]|uniref:asparagine synthase (glutamine-hydrolyzing) n=1 Tax=Aliidiomarina minuta TaxID=880057 RepID=A0A432W687_9GAMM|nr:N-acetylglutaminylglutamine amidotransferase [Aliidiomarina minuta]RUO25577.1 N-acetylglutaminylglutamine amidotransferase [Aliidiomarina minuta]
MCGIVGEIRFRGETKAHRVEDMLKALSPRGPDGKGIFSTKKVTFGHRRLSVIDLSSQGSQPMHDAKLGLTLIFNGCIYNYRKLRGELQGLGYEFFSTSDSEVILKAFHKWGEDCLKKLTGMFAFAVLERDSGDIFLARDRLGIKPLYFHHNDHGFWFASTLPALLKCDFVPTLVNPVALHQYMSFRTIVEDQTLFRYVYKLKAGHWMKISAEGETQIHAYWNLPVNSGPSDDSEVVWKERLKEALYTSIERRLEADVPVGVLLSGGLDSSLVVGMLDQLGQKDIHTFSIGFENIGEEEGDEFRYSDIIARQYATDHHKILTQHNTLLTHLEPCIAAMAEPMVSHDVIGFYLLSKEVSKYVKVVQSGQGADEVFGGYHWYPPMTEADENSAAKVYAQHYFSWAEEDLKQVLAPAYRDAAYGMDYVREYFSACKAELPIDKALHLDVASMVVDDPVKRLDNMSMAFGLEARVPFLDHDLVELASQIPYELKIKDGGKYLLKEVARDIIPHEVIDRPKGYFPVPALRNMRGPYLTLARHVFSKPHARQRGLFDMQYIDQMLDSPEDFRGPFGSKLWQVTLLEMWLTQHNIALSHG